MLQINPKRFKNIQNKTIPSPLRPKFINKEKANIYFLSKRRVDVKKKELVFKRIKITLFIILLGVSGFLLSN